MRRIIVSLRIIAMVAPTAPAAAAMPEARPNRTLQCANGKVAKVWDEATYPDWAYDEDGDPEKAYATHVRVAAQNPFKGQWLQLTYHNDSVSNSGEDLMWLAPGARFNWDQRYLKRFGADDLYPFGPSVALVAPEEVCDPPSYESEDGDYSYSGNAIGKIHSYKDVRPVRQCGAKYPASKHRWLDCGDDYARVSYKLGEDRKVLKLAVYNYCDHWVYTYWYEGPGNGADGKWSAVLVRPHSFTDLWKDELRPLPARKASDFFTLGLTEDPCKNTDGAWYHWWSDRFFIVEGDTVVKTSCLPST